MLLRAYWLNVGADRHSPGPFSLYFVPQPGAAYSTRYPHFVTRNGAHIHYEPLDYNAAVNLMRRMA